MSKLKWVIRLARDEGLWRAIVIIVFLSLRDKLAVIRTKRRFLSGNASAMLDLRINSIKENRRMWDRWDWSCCRGEEWTLEVKGLRDLEPDQWKADLVNAMILKYVREASTVLEIGPGAGRWTHILADVADRLILVDISERALEACKERFKLHSNIEYHLIDGRLDCIPSDSIDHIWAYDVFVHINPSDVDAYINDFQRVLKPGGCAVIHHAGEYTSEAHRKARYAAFMTRAVFASLVMKHGLTMVEQNDSAAHYPGDLISVFSK